MKKRIFYIVVAILLLYLVIIGSVWLSQNSITLKGNRMQRIMQSPNYKNSKFQNKVPTAMMLEGSFIEMFKEYVFGKQLRTPSESLPVVKLDPASIGNSSKNDVKLTWLGHSSVLIEFGELIVLTDPVFNLNPGPVSPFTLKRFHSMLPLESNDMPEVDLVIISHNHYDHLDYKTIKAIHKKVKKFAVPLGVAAYLEKWGVDPAKIVELDWYEDAKISPALKIRATPSQHFSGRGFFDRDKTLWASWVIEGKVGSKKRKVFFSGDSGYSASLAEIGKEYGPFDVTILEMAQYSRFWPDLHMNPEQAIRAHMDLRGKLMLPIHWGTFNLSLHSWTEPIERLVKEAAGKKVLVATPIAGAPFAFSSTLPTEHWWKDTDNRDE
ncbi:MAG: MBL fold metallo-hydrolase [Leptospirales bacterium]